MTHCRQLDRETSPDRLAFQIARTTISLNYPGEELETLDREILVIFVDVPPQDGETDEQCQERENTTPPELFGDNKSSPLLPQAQFNNQFNNRLTPDKSTTTPVNKYLRHQLVLCSGAMTIHLAPTDCMQETFSGTLNATALKSTTTHKPI
jgi:hypothetical protein